MALTRLINLGGAKHERGYFYELNQLEIIQKVLEPYVDVSDNDFVKLSRKAVNDFFDWAVQSKSGDQSINKDIARILNKGRYCC